MRALVTGACGFVGRHLCHHLVAAGDEVTAGTFTPGAGERLPCPSLYLDVTDAVAVRRVIEQCRPEAIYHLAGLAFVPEAEEDFGRTLRVNVESVANICRAAADLAGAPAVVFVSSAEVYGKVRPGDNPLTESQPPAPANNYSLSKVMGELVVHRYAAGGGIRGVVVRPFNHLGPGQDPRFVASSFARQLALIARGEAPPVLHVGNLTPERDFSDVRDIVRGYRLAALHGGGTWNLCSGRAVPVQQILDTLIEVSGLQVEVRPDPARMRPAEVPRIEGCFAQAERELGWRPEIPLADTLSALYQFWRGA